MLFGKKENSGNRPVKGTGVKSMIQFAKDRGGDAGLQKVLQSLPEEDRNELTATILPTSRFKEETNQALINGIVNNLLGGDAEKAVEIGKFLIHDGLTFVYKMLYRVGNPGWIISNANILWKQYHEIGSLDVIESTSNSCRLQLNFPYLDKAFCRVIVGCSIESLRLSGAKNVDVVHEKCIAKGDPYCLYAITWDL